ncbi:MAG: hypothetical protein K8S23_00990, partial [Candidatus Cloacimonetes bacterium]|nr:hypothetical protein [Candidatus Cloacimonadota bacterium]
MKRNLIFIFLLISTILFSIKFEKKLHFTNYTVEDGLPNKHIWCIFQDSDSHMWFGTTAGVSRFDGKQFECFSKIDGLAGNYVLEIQEASDGNILFATSGGLSIFDGYSFNNITIDDGLLNNDVKSIAVDNENNIWIATPKELSKFDGKQIINNKIEMFSEVGTGKIFIAKDNSVIIGSRNIRRFKNNNLTPFIPLSEGFSFWSILKDTKDNIWFETDGKINRFDGENVTTFDENDGVIMERSDITCYFEDSKGNIWFGTQGGGVGKYNGKEFKYYTTDDGLIGDHVWAIGEDNEGNMWFGAKGGISKLSDNFTKFITDGEYLNYFIREIVEDKNKNIWLQMKKELFKFDGNSFSKVSKEQGIICDSIMTLNKDSVGNIWFGAQNGVTKYDGEKFENFTSNNEILGKNTKLYFEDSKHNVWFGTDKGLNKYENDKFLNIQMDRTNIEFTDAFEDNKENIWFGTNQGVLKFSNGKLTDLKKYTSSILPNNDIKCMIEDDKFNFWFATSDNGLIKISKKKEIIQFNEENGFIDNELYSLMKDSMGAIWIGTWNSGVCIYKNEEFSYLSEKNGLISDKKIRVIFEDNNGLIWIGTEKGISIYNGIGFNNYSKKSGLCDNVVRCITEDINGNIWIGTNNGVDKVDLNKNNELTILEHFDTTNGLTNNKVFSVLEDTSGKIWIGTDKGLCSFENNHFNVHYENKSIWRIFEDSKNILWFGHSDRSNVLQYKNQNFISLTEKDGLLNGSLFSFFEDSDGVIYSGCSEGIMKEIGKNIEIFSANHPVNGLITSIYEDENENMWFCTELRGICRFNGTDLKTFTKSDGLIGTDWGPVIQYDGDIYEDNIGNIYYISFNGINKIEKNEILNNWKEDSLKISNVYISYQDKKRNIWIGSAGILNKISNGKISQYNREDGVMTTGSIIEDYNENVWFNSAIGVSKLNGDRLINFNSKNGLYDSNSRVFPVSENNVWFVSENALTHYNYEKDKENHIVSKINIKKVLNGNIALNIKNVIKIPFTKNVIEINYVSPQFKDQVNLIYQYKLEGFNKEWITTKETEIKYNFLPFGKYTFKVQVQDRFSQWSENPAEFSFTILPPWYKTLWFNTIFAIAMISLLYLIYKARVRILEKTQKKLENEVENRTHELSEAYSDIEEKNIKLTDSIEYALLIQNSILPKEKEISKYNNNFFIIWKPKDIVGGDFYWFFPIPDSRNYIISVIDCTGHGVPGAFMSMTANSILNN